MPRISIIFKVGKFGWGTFALRWLLQSMAKVSNALRALCFVENAARCQKIAQSQRFAMRMCSSLGRRLSARQLVQKLVFVPFVAISLLRPPPPLSRAPAARPGPETSILNCSCGLLSVGPGPRPRPTASVRVPDILNF